jgi:hypothetical protein
MICMASTAATSPSPDRSARILATTVMAWASVLMGDPIIAGFLWESDPALRVFSRVACSLSTLGITLGLLGWFFRKPRSLLALGFGTLVAAGLNASVCAVLAERNPIVAPFVLTLGALVWGPIAFWYFGVFAVYARGMRVVSASPSRDSLRRHALLAASWLLGLATIYRLYLHLAPFHASVVFLLAAPVLPMGVALLVWDLRDLAFLSRVLDGKQPPYAIRDAAPMEHEGVPPFVAGATAPRADWILVEETVSGVGPFREVRRGIPRFSLERGAKSLRRRTAFTAALVLASIVLLLRCAG